MAAVRTERQSDGSLVHNDGQRITRAVSNEFDSIFARSGGGEHVNEGCALLVLRTFSLFARDGGVENT